MITLFRKHTNSTTILLAIIMASVLPITSVVLAYIFRNDIVPDKPKLVEESIKTVVSFFVSFLCIFISNLFTTINTGKKITGLRKQIQLRISALNNTLAEAVHIPVVLDRVELESASAQVLRENHLNLEKYKGIITSLVAEIEKIGQFISAVDVEVSTGCSDYSEVIYQCVSAINDFLLVPTSIKKERVDLYIKTLLSLRS